MAKNLVKVTFLNEVNKRKTVLFGPLTPQVTKQSKQKAWQEIHAIAESLGIVNSGKSWTYVRDTVWPNLRKRALEKRDNAKRTGTGGGKEMKMTEVDNKVIEILGKDSMSVNGIGVNDTLETTPETEEQVFQLEPEIAAAEELLQSSEEINVVKSPTLKRLRNTKKKSEPSTNLEIENLKRKKLQLEVEYLEKLNRKTELEILKLEKELNSIN